jgi:shikimate kinase
VKNANSLEDIIRITYVIKAHDMYEACTSENHPASSDAPDDSAGFSRRYSEDATLVLVGFHGAGKKTLGIIASVALRRRFVDFDAVFRQHLSSSPQDYIAAHGLAQYRTVEAEVSQKLLETYDKGCVIVGLAGAANHQQQAFIRTFARTHPVVYIRRDETDLRQFITASEEKFQRFLQAGDTFFQACSNFEFFNLTLGDVQQTQGRPLPSSLKLKEAERVFVRFLYQILGLPHPTLLSPDAFSPSQTLAMQVPLRWLDLDEHLESLDAGADAVNLIVDSEEMTSAGLQRRLARSIALLRMHSRVPIIVDIRAGNSDPRYPRALEMALRLAPDAVTCSVTCTEAVIQRVIATKGCSKAIATYHQSIPLGWDSQPYEVYNLPEKAEEMGFECLRLTGESGASQDNLACVALRQSLTPRSKVPLTMYNTGPLGRTSVCLNPILSPVVLPDSGVAGVTLPKVQRALTACFMNPAKRYTIVGQAVQNSLSPAMHNAAYTACGLPHSYDAYKPTQLYQVQALLENPDYGGLAVSLPYKSAILPFLDEIRPDARDINAVNTVVLERQYEPNGTEVTVRKGYNTDYIGVRHCIQKHLSPANAIRDGTTALVIGAGGMARAAIYACYELGVRRFCIYNRTVENAEGLAEYYHEWASKKRQDAKFWIEVICSASDPWPVDFRLPSIVVSCLPGQEVDSVAPVELSISKDWLQSTTGGVFLEVCILDKSANSSLTV